MSNYNIGLTEQEKQDILKIKERLNKNIDTFMKSTEEQIKMSIILPLFEVLGYDTRDVETFKSEVDFDGDRVDYLIKAGESTIIVECKKLSNKLTLREIKQLSGYYSSCRDESKLGILTNGDKFLFFKPDGNSQNHMPLEPFTTIELSTISYDKLEEKFAQFTRDNMVVWSLSEDRNLADFREKVREFLTQIKHGIFPAYVMEMLCTQSNTLKLYRDKPDEFYSAIKDEIEITLGIDEYGFKHIGTLDKFEITEDEIEIADTPELDTTNIEEESKIIKNKEYVFTDNTFSDYKGCRLDYAILMHKNKIENLSSRQLLCNIIQTVVELNSKNKDILLKQFSSPKGNYRITSGKVEQKEFYYIESCDVSVFVKSAIDTIFRFIQKILDTFDISYDNVVVSFKE